MENDIQLIEPSILLSAETGFAHKQLLEEVIDRTVRADLFNHAKDQSIAVNIFDKLTNRLLSREISAHAYLKAVEALNDLIPRRNHKGWRVISDIQVTPIMERVIHSRAVSPEIDIAAPEGSWGRLPEVVKKSIANESCMIIEINSTCTVRCSFCALAEKGPIEKKMQFNSVLQVVQYFAENKELTAGVNITYSDCLYWGSDPFDAKWQSADGSERDYCDMANAYWGIVSGKPRYLYSSTAVPIGEEMRILNFINELHKKLQGKEINQHNKFRISKTNANKKRVESIEKIVFALYGPDIFDSETVYISDNRHENVARAGKQWEAESMQITEWDILGPNCRDDVLIKIDALEGVIMQASSNERQMGELRFPIEEKTDDGTQIFTIPQHTEKPNDFANVFPWEVYPNTRLRITAIKDGHETSRVKVVTEDPHRAFLRVVGMLKKIIHDSGGEYEKVSESYKKYFQQLVEEEIQLVQSYLDMGADNISMRLGLAQLRADGFIS